jgi:hypothetical protein
MHLWCVQPRVDLLRDLVDFSLQAQPVAMDVYSIGPGELIPLCA